MTTQAAQFSPGQRVYIGESETLYTFKGISEQGHALVTYHLSEGMRKTFPDRPETEEQAFDLDALCATQEEAVKRSQAWRRERDEAMGPCKVCGRKITWFNDVPLRGFCWGTEQEEHDEYSKLVPKKFNRYL